MNTNDTMRAFGGHLLQVRVMRNPDADPLISWPDDSRKEEARNNLETFARQALKSKIKVTEEAVGGQKMLFGSVAVVPGETYMQILGLLQAANEHVDRLVAENVNLRTEVSSWKRVAQDAEKELGEAQRAVVVLGNWKRTILARMGCLLDTAANGRGSFEEHLLAQAGKESADG